MTTTVSLADRIQSLRNDFAPHLGIELRVGVVVQDGIVRMFVGPPLEILEPMGAVIGGFQHGEPKDTKLALTALDLTALAERGGNLLAEVHAAGGWQPSYWAFIDRQSGGAHRWAAFMLTGTRALAAQTWDTGADEPDPRFWFDDFVATSQLGCDSLLTKLPAPILSPNDARDRWLYGLYKQGMEWDSIVRQLKDNKEGYEPMGRTGVIAAVKRHAERFGLPYESRQRGRKKAR